MSELEETEAKGIAEAKEGTRVMDYNEVVPDLTDHKFDWSGNLPESSSVSIRNKKTSEWIKILIRELPESPPEPPSIFRVHKGLRSVNEKAYTPILVSIGPYHHENPNLSAMKQHKLRYLRSYLQRINNNNDIDTINVGPYLLRMEKLADRAQACYADPICLDREKFVEMLLLDACFILEFLCKYHFHVRRDEDDPIFRSSWMMLKIAQDLMLLENQIPFFVVSELFDVTLIPASYRDVTVIRMAALFPVSMMLPKQYSETKTEELIEKTSAAGESKHFLDLVHRLHLPSSGRQDSYWRSTRMSCVTELQEAGISFKVDKSDDISIFDISFENGRMKIPKVQVNDDTRRLLLNIVAYEQHSSSDDPKYFSDYLCFMNLLIKTKKDVNALRDGGIMDNLLADEEVTSLFHKLDDEIVIEAKTFYYSDVCQKVNNHYLKLWNQARAHLIRNPWRGVSTAAATVLLLLTIIQTVIAFIGLRA